MSNHLSIAAVTATLRRMLQTAIDSDEPNIPEAKVSAVRPNAPAAELPATGINVFLYRVTPNVALRSADLPTRRGEGTVVQRPRAALDLHYLLSFYGDEKRLEPQILLASAVRALHASPVLDRHAILPAVRDPGVPFPFPDDVDLADDPEMVRFSPTALSLEELSKLWSVLFQTPYVLSIAYQASVLLVEAPLPKAPEALPVREPRVVATPFPRGSGPLGDEP
jgi:hypothetical protein